MVGGNTQLSVEIDPIACVTLKENAQPGQVVKEADVTECTGPGIRRWAGLSRTDPLVIVGGAPCQPFSKAAYWVEEGNDAAWRRDRALGINRERPPSPTKFRPDDRRSLIEHFMRLVIEAKADAFVFENVPAIQHPRNRPILDRLIRDAQLNAFSTVVVKALASDYGVPQHRERVFVLGSKQGLPEAPKATHDGRELGTSGLLPAVSSGEACAPFSGKEFFEREEVMTGKWAELLRDIPPGWNYKFHTEWGGHPRPSFVAEQRFWNFLLVLDPKKPSWTIPANPGPSVGPFHWKHRRLRTPELSAIQGFPTGYEFAGSRRERVRQIGNAVPPRLAAQMVSSVFATLSSQKKRRRK
jgi:DNA (cytosine-5)-methyltransferase 1